MRLEDMEHEFPKMPENMRAMIEREVEKQMKTETEQSGKAEKITGKAAKTAGAAQTAKATGPARRRNKRMARRTLVAALVAAMVLGTTVFAGVVYQMRAKSAGKYAVEIKTEGNSGEIAGTESSEQINIEIPTVKMDLSYVPEGMVETEKGKYSYEDNLYHGGVSIVFYAMDTGDDQFEMLEKGVIASEEMNVNGYSGVYLEYQSLIEDEISFNQRIYVAYTDVHYVMEMFVGSDVAKDEAIKVAEGVKLTPVTDATEEQNIVCDFSWSGYLASLEEAEVTEEFSETTVDKSALSNTHGVGESFSLNTFADDEDGNLTVKVADVQICDDIHLLDTSLLDQDERKELDEVTDESGNLLPTELSYVKRGDGVDSLSEIVKTREAEQKLIYVTVEYTNANDFELNNVLFFGNLVKMKEDGNVMRMYFGETGDDWNEVQYSGPATHREMWYYDVHGGERGNNYIANIGAGETVTVHMAWIVPEEELPYCYLNLDTYGGCYEFSDTSLAVGYVDLNQ